MLSIAQEIPVEEDVLHLLRQSDADAAALYPPESTHLLDAALLTASHVRFLVARREGQAVGCGALVVAAAGQAELKRLFVDAAARGQGIGLALVQALEEEARRDGVRLIQLETGRKQPEALGLYRRCGYRERGPFGGYRPDPLSVFMEKLLPPT